MDLEGVTVSETPVEAPVSSGVSPADPPGWLPHARGRARGRARAKASVASGRLRQWSSGTLLPVAVGDRHSPWSERLPSLPDTLRYAAEGEWCTADPAADGLRATAGGYARWVAGPAIGLLVLVMWAALLPVTGFTSWPHPRTETPLSLAELVRLAGDRGWPGRTYLTFVILLAAPAYALVAVLSRPCRLLAAALITAVVAAAVAPALMA
jgi:hypothetical protein